MEATNNVCPICESPSVNENKDYSRKFIVQCERCGKFQISKLSITTTDFKTKTNARAIVSHWIRKHQAYKKVMISSELLIDIIENNDLLSPIEQANNLIIHVGENVSSPEEFLIDNYYSITGIIGAANISNTKYVTKHLSHQGYITAIIDSGNQFQAYLTFKGWEKYDELKRSSTESRRAFMAMKFGVDDTDKLFNDTLKPVVEETGFDLRKLDDKAPAGLIDNRLRVEIRKAKFLIADLTHDNPGAYFESGFAEGLGKPVIYICEKSKFESDKTHFDTNHHLTLKWDMDNLDDFKEQLKATIRATFPEDAKMEDD